MAAFFRDFAPPGRLVLVRPIDPTPPVAKLVCAWRRDSHGRLVRSWTHDGDEPCAPVALAWAA